MLIKKKQSLYRKFFAFKNKVNLEKKKSPLDTNRQYRYQLSAMHYGSISGTLRNKISLRGSILLQVKDVSLKGI